MEPKLINFTIGDGENTTCAKCRSVKGEAVNVALTMEVNGQEHDVVMFLCQSCLIDAIAAAVSDGEGTQMIAGDK